MGRKKIREEIREYMNLKAQELSKEDQLKAVRKDIKEYVGVLGRRLGEVRKKIGYSQKVIAERMGVKRSQVSRIDSGKYGGLTVQMFLRYWQALFGMIGQVSLCDFYAMAQSLEKCDLSKWKIRRD